MEDIEALAWRNADDKDLWLFDKLILARRLGYNCGPAGMNVPKQGHYIVRPCVNIPGMGRGAYFTDLDKETNHLPYGTFWCEVFTGDHLSIDYKDRKQVLAVRGEYYNDHELWRFKKWEKVNVNVSLPSILNGASTRYEYLNLEMIGDKVIEVHTRHNPNFSYGNTVAYPVWQDQTNDYPEGLKFIESKDYKRLGFYID